MHTLMLLKFPPHNSWRWLDSRCWQLTLTRRWQQWSAEVNNFGPVHRLIEYMATHGHGASLSSSSKHVKKCGFPRTLIYMHMYNGIKRKWKYLPASAYNSVHVSAVPEGPIIPTSSPGLKYSDIPLRIVFFLTLQQLNLDWGSCEANQTITTDATTLKHSLCMHSSLHYSLK